MSFFDNILRSRKIKWHNDIHLWSLRLSNDEYYELKEALKHGAKYREFTSLRREATLYYAEWWRREFSGGHASTKDVCESIFGDAQLSEKLYEAAKCGARTLNIQIIRTQGEERDRDNIRYSIFYQGGLPMNYIISEIQRSNHSAWDRFFRKLVWKLHDYTDVSESLGVTAPLSDSIKAFCETLRISADSLTPNQQPYYHNEVWWNVIIRNFEEEKRKRKARSPFESIWLFGLDEVDKKISVGFKFSGPQTLSAEFITEHNLVGKSFTTFSLLVNNAPVFTPEYDKRFYCRRNVEKNVLCSVGDTITVVINETGEVISNRDINFDTPKVAYLIDEDKNIFRLGDAQHLKDEVCRIIATEDWNCECKFDIFTIDGINYKVFYPEMGTDQMVFYSESRAETRTINPGSESPKTFIDFRCALKLQVPTKEIIFNTEDTVLFYEACNETEINRARPCSVYYAEKGSQQWISRPKFGEIRARVRRSDNEAVEPVKFLNAGNLNISYISSSRDTCEIKIDWKHGSVETEDAEVGERENIWVINRNTLADRRYAKFKFIPCPGQGSEFTLTILPPFFGFNIYDKMDRKMGTNSIIPMVDINDFRYYFHLPGIMHLYPNGIRGDLRYVYCEDNQNHGNKITEYLCGNKQRSSFIPYEGRLASMFIDGSEQIHRMINHSCLSLPDAEAKIAFQDGARTHMLTFKAFPYRLKYETGMVIVKNTSVLPRYDADLLAIPIDSPECEPVILQQSKELRNCYLLPDIITNSAYSRWLIYGRLRGYVLPFAIDTKEELDRGRRDGFRANKIDELKHEFLSAPIFDSIWKRAIDWYKRLPLGRIPGTSILELVAIADDNMLIKKFALHLWFDTLNRNESMDTLKASLIEFSEQMSFLWAWVTNESIIDFAIDYLNADNSQLLKYYYTWVLSLPDDSSKKQYLLTNPAQKSAEFLLSEFQEWLNIVIQDGMPRQNLEYPDVNTNGDGLISREAKEHFACVRETISNWKNLSPNELWIQERHMLSNIFQAVLNFGDIDGNENIKREIRKSIITGLTYSNNRYEF